MSGKRLTIRTDGACRGNPGPSGIGVFMRVDGENAPREFYAYIGETTNNVAEYKALLLGLDEAEKLGAASVTVLADSELLVKQINGQYKVKSEGLRPLFLDASRRLRSFPSARVTHVPREENRDADRLANKAIDEYDRGR
ncbi:MAG TPA: ribonuclease HI family protein [Candidatus Deferrimicrobiaceae bacterium]|jgi:ribonuclease HI